MKHLVSINDLDKDSAIALLDLADELKSSLLEREIRKLPTLRGRTVFTVFYENSTRTRCSFETAGKWLSADVVNISAGSSSVEKGESLQDTGQTLTAIGAEALIVRHPNSGAPAQLAHWLCPDGIHGPSIINAGDGQHEHPSQALLDALTFRQHHGGFEGRKLVVVGDILHSRVARSDLLLFSMLGAEVVFVAPPTLLPVGVEDWPCRVSYDLDAELRDADAVQLLRVQEERMKAGEAFFPSVREYAALYGMSKKRLAALPDDAIVMHPGPMIRGMEINFDVADSPQAAVLQQVNNGVHVRMAILITLLTGDREA